MSKIPIKTYAIIFFVSLVAALILAEIYFRFLSSGEYKTAEELRKEQALEHDTAMFARSVLVPDQQNVKGFAGATYRVNSLGYRGKDFSADKPKDVKRVMIYGGSQVFDIRADETYTWPNLVERKLHRNGFDNIEVINSGVPGYTSFDSLGALFAEGYRFAPDYVVIDNAWNDIRTYFTSNEPLLRSVRPAQPWRDPRIYYRFPGDRFLSENFQLYGRIRHSVVNWQVGGELEGKAARWGIEGEFSQATESALVQYELNLRMFVDLARNIGARPVLMIQPRLVKEDNSPSQRERIAYHLANMTHDGLVAAFAETNSIIQRVADEKNVPIIDLSEKVNGRSEYFSDHVHLTADGSEVTAVEFVEQFSTILNAK